MVLPEEKGGHPGAKRFTGCNAFDLEQVPLGHEGEADALENGRAEEEGKGEEGEEVKGRSCAASGPRGSRRRKLEF